AFPPDSGASPAIIRTKVEKLPEPETHPGRRYRLLTVPLDFGAESHNLDEVLSNQFGTYDPIRWRALRYIPELDTNVELLPGDTTGRFRPVPGRGFWLITQANHQVNTGLVPG